MSDTGATGDTGEGRNGQGPEPRANPSLIGHGAAQDVLLDSWRSGRLAHAWLLHGPRGVGKATLAYRFARFILAQGAQGISSPEAGPEEIDPRSPLFRRVASGGHSDLLTVERGINEETGARHARILVGDVRRVNAFLALTPGEGSWRVVIVDSADEMNRNAANALLKLLEEPPRRVLFLLLSQQPGRLSATIVSRCRRLALEPLKPKEVAAFLTQRLPDCPAGEAEALAEMAEGSPGRALELAERSGLTFYRDLVGLIGTLPEIDMAALHGFADRLSRRNAEDDFRSFTELTTWWLARLVRSGVAGTVPPEIAPGEGAVIGRFLAAPGLDRWVAVWHKLSGLFAEAERYNLDRKQVVLNAFATLERAARA